jgi:hypothetical protein
VYCSRVIVGLLEFVITIINYYKMWGTSANE